MPNPYCFQMYIHPIYFDVNPKSSDLIFLKIDLSHLQSLEKLVMEARTPLEWDLKTLDQFAGLSFRANFNFSLVGYLLKVR